MKVGVDLNWMIGEYRGMGRFARQFIEPVSENVVGFAPSGKSTDEWRCVSKGSNFFPAWEQINLPRHCKKENIDILVCPYNTGPLTGPPNAKKIAVIHDLIFMEPRSRLPLSPSGYQNFGRYYRRLVVPQFAKSADAIVTVSEFSKSEIVSKIGVSEHKIHVIPNSIDDYWFQDPVPIDQRGNYFFTVAGEQTSKNVPALLQAFAKSKLSSQGARLVIAGIKAQNHKTFEEMSKAFGILQNVEFLGFISERDLMNYYRNAKVFVFASTFEGFGIPILEALATGTPVVASNTTSIPEVAGNCSMYFNPRDIDEIAANLHTVWTDEAYRFALANRATEQARTFSRSKINERIQQFWANQK